MSRLINLNPAATGNFIPVNDGTKIYVQSDNPVSPAEGDTWINVNFPGSQLAFRREGGAWRHLCAWGWYGDLATVTAGQRYLVLPLARQITISNCDMYWQGTGSHTAANCLTANIHGRLASTGVWSAIATLGNSIGVTATLEKIERGSAGYQIASTYNAIAISFAATGTPPGTTRFSIRARINDFL